MPASGLLSVGADAASRMHALLPALSHSQPRDHRAMQRRPATLLQGSCGDRAQADPLLLQSARHRMAVEIELGKLALTDLDGSWDPV